MIKMRNPFKRCDDVFDQAAMLPPGERGALLMTYIRETELTKREKLVVEDNTPSRFITRAIAVIICCGIAMIVLIRAVNAWQDVELTRIDAAYSHAMSLEKK